MLLFSNTTVLHFARRLTRTHTWLMKWVLMRPVRHDVTIIMWVKVPNVSGWMPCLDSRNQLGTGDRAARAAVCQQLWLLLSCFGWEEHLWLVSGRSKPTPPPLVFCVFLIPYWCYLPLDFPYLFPSLISIEPFCFISLLLSLSFPPSHFCPPPPPPPLLLNSDRLFISFCLAA